MKFGGTSMAGTERIRRVASIVRKQQAADNPWGAGATTLEWTLSSPPPFHQFEVLPRIK